MEAFKALLEVAERLMSPDGCPWDKEQTFESLRPYILEEAHELLEAVDLGRDEDIIEELGDLLYTVIFYTKIAEKNGRFSLDDVLKNLKAKLIHRHPHVFGKEKAVTIDDVKVHWEKAKKKEKKDRKSPFEGIPKTLPGLQRGQKIFQKIQINQDEENPIDPSELIEELVQMIKKANQAEIDMESLLRERLAQEEKNVE